MATICCRIGLSVKERKWGRSGYNKDVVHVNYETTPTRPEPATDHTDSGGREDSYSGRRGSSTSGGDGMALVSDYIMVCECS